jgi:hypothetical protein
MILTKPYAFIEPSGLVSATDLLPVKGWKAIRSGHQIHRPASGQGS